jgi:hypothetical protein
MPTSSGPNTSGENSLVFAYDVADLRNSYIGEPTANLLPTPTTNAIPKIGNGWGTYNTNQYNGGNFFSIGTISSVSSNIVTTAGTHPLRTYDVVQPQTTGGGVTAGVNYFVKKISDTQFSLHEYNSSQDGSQGYINTSTGNFKVYDSIATDTRVSINSTSFPNMWWGYPHLPNSGLVKEIIPNGFKDPNTGIVTDCLRLHWHRADGVTDGMAYNVDASFTANQTVCCSFWMRAFSNSAVGKVVQFYHYTYGVTSPTDYFMNAAVGPLGEWRRYSYTFTSPNNTVISYWFPSYGPMDVDISNIQIEQKDHATQFIAGTRSSTQGLLDLTRNSTASLTNASFNSNAQIVFDGTNDYINVPYNTSHNLTNQGTISVWINPASLTQGSFAGIVAQCTGGSANQQAYTLSWRQISNALLGQICNGSGTYNEMYAPLPTTANVWYNIVFLWNGSNLIMYNNGVVISTATQTINSQVLSTDLTIGGYTYKGAGGGGEYFNGSIAKVEIYNRALGVSEVLNNYRAYKKRFNLS